MTALPTYTHNSNVLILSNNSEKAGVIALMCAFMGYRSMTAARTEELNDLADNHNIDAVVIDYHNLYENGLTVLFKLRQLGQNVPAVMITNHSAFADLLRPSFLNVAKVLVDPISEQALGEALEEILGEVKLHL